MKRAQNIQVKNLNNFTSCLVEDGSYINSCLYVNGLWQQKNFEKCPGWEVVFCNQRGFFGTNFYWLVLDSLVIQIDYKTKQFWHAPQ